MTCLTCGVEIPPERRAAMPLAEFCVKCQPPTPLVITSRIHEAMAEAEIEPGDLWPRSR